MRTIPFEHGNIPSILTAFVVLVSLIAGAESEAADMETEPLLGDAQLLRLQPDAERARVPFLSWDTEGGDRIKTNLLRSDSALSVRVQVAGEWKSCGEIASARFQPSPKEGRYTIPVTPGTELEWDIQTTSNTLTLRVSGRGDEVKRIEAVEIVFPFDPQVTPTTVLPTEWDADGSLSLPAVLSAPDFGQMLLIAEPNTEVRAKLLGSRAQKTVDLAIRFSGDLSQRPYELRLSPVWLPAPEGMRDTSLWREARRGWFGALQPSAQWGDPGNRFSAPAGVLANNVVSDPASCSLWFYADQAFWTPEISPGISVMTLVRRSIDWWLDERMQPTGEMICYWDHLNFLDANAGPLIAAWDYVEATGDLAWLKQRIDKLEAIAEFLAGRDVDGDGMVEATQSGNRGTLKQPHRSCAWWDALNCGHKDSYTNALIYRAWRCLADLENQLGRSAQVAHYQRLADRLKAAYKLNLYNPETGWLGWWRSADGELHDYASPIVNGLAIEYGLIEPELGREILARLREKMRVAGFTRYELGVPPMLIPVRRSDYLLPHAIGLPSREDGTDTFGQYMNGGITAGQVLHFIAAHYAVGEREQGDFFLREMLKRQAEGGFQNGVQDSGGKGIDWTTWDGKPCGYEGYLADSFRFLQALLLREPALRERFYRPLTGGDQQP